VNALPAWFVPLVLAAPLAGIGAFVLAPLVVLAVRAGTALGPTLASARTGEVLAFTLGQATLSTVVALALGVGPGIVLARHRVVGRRVVLSLLTAVFVLPTVVMAAGVRSLLPGSLDHGLPAIVTAHALFNLAVVVRLVAAVAVPEGVIAAARTLGAGPRTVLGTIIVPVVRPAVVSAAAIVFAFSFTSYGVVRVLGDVSTSTIEVEIWRQAIQLGRVDTAMALTVVQLVAIGIVTAAGVRMSRRSAVRWAAGTASTRTAAGAAGTVAVAATAVLAMAPLVALVAASFRVGGRFSTSGWANLLDDAIRPGLRLGLDPWGALVRSTVTASVAASAAVVLGAFAAVGVATARRAGRAVDVLVMAPLAVSAVTVGLGLVVTYARPPVDWRASWFLLPLGHALVALPFVLRPVLAAARATDERLRWAAATLGATPLRAVATGVVPALRRPLVAGAGLAAAVSLGEFGASSVLSRTGGETLPVVIERLLARTGGDFQARGHALAVVLALLTIALVALVDIGADAPGSPDDHRPARHRAS
jgi:thiamine transport system permease protein